MSDNPTTEDPGDKVSDEDREVPGPWVEEGRRGGGPEDGDETLVNVRKGSEGPEIGLKGWGMEAERARTKVPWEKGQELKRDVSVSRRRIRDHGYMTL